MKRMKLIACSVTALGALLLTGCESTPTASMQVSSRTVSSPGHIQGYRGAGSAVESGERSGVFSPGHIQGYRSEIVGYSMPGRSGTSLPSHVNGY